MTDKPEDQAESIRRLAESLAKQPTSTDAIQRIARQLRQDQDRWQNVVNRLSHSMPALSSLEQIAAVKSNNIQKERELLERIESLSGELTKEKQEKQKQEELAQQLQDALAEYQRQEEIKYLLGKLSKDAEDNIRNDPDFLGQFAPGTSHNTYVLAIDIRASTDLMLNAKTPSDFADFITVLCDKLTDLVISNGGVFDKFTGDGVLAFFPEFYSGSDAGYRALQTASQAIAFFKEHYTAHRHYFRVVATDTGLGVGIDYGTVHFVSIGESLSVVGTPVVYACRLSAAPAERVYLNQPAQEQIDSRYRAHTTIR